ncbi:MAG: acyl-CoA dehydrogenase [bacterium]
MAFRVDRRDIDFILKEVLDLNKILELDAYKDFSLEDIEMTITEGIRFATEKVAPLNKDSDKIGAQFKDGKVTTPPGMKEVYKEYCENGWNGIGASQEFGGMGMPGIAAIPVGEALVGACVTFMMTPGLNRGSGHLIESFGTDEQKALYVEKMYSGEWAGTMCLTEPQAGSAVGDIKTMATPVEGEDNKYMIVGTKSFITSGEHDMTDQIIHLLLAKVPGAPAGFKGISLFIVPKIKVNPDGSLGEPNDVACGGIEHKMGIHGSPTCTLNFGENGNCEGYLVGELNKGLFHMFQMMNEARIGVGVQGMAQAAACYHEALDYAKERVQGVDIAEMRNLEAPRVPIIKHPDIRRMLMTMKATTEGSRALLYMTAYHADIALCSSDEKEREKSHEIIELLTPTCKAYCTDAAFRATDLGIQILGGYGYCQEYPVEQYLRDVKIAAIYEGTNGIQALDLLGRKLGMKGGMVFMNYLMKINNFLSANAKDELLGPLCKILGEARDKMAAIVGKFQAMGKKDMYYPILQATPFLELFSEVVIGQLLLEHAKIANEKLQAILKEKGCDSDEKKKAILEDSSEAAFYHNKIQTAAFYVTQIVPGVFAKAYSMDTGDRSPLEVVF